MCAPCGTGRVAAPAGERCLLGAEGSAARFALGLPACLGTVWELPWGRPGDVWGMPGGGGVPSSVARRQGPEKPQTRFREGPENDQRSSNEERAEPWPAPAAGERPGLSCLKMRRFRKDLQGFHFQNGGHVARSLDALPPRCRSAGFPDIRGCGLPMDQGSEARDQGRSEPP